MGKIIFDCQLYLSSSFTLLFQKTGGIWSKTVVIPKKSFSLRSARPHQHTNIANELNIYSGVSLNRASHFAVSMFRRLFCMLNHFSNMSWLPYRMCSGCLTYTNLRTPVDLCLHSVIMDLFFCTGLNFDSGNENKV